MRNLPQGYAFVGTDTVLKTNRDQSTFFVSEAYVRHMNPKTNIADGLEVLADATRRRIETNPVELSDGSSPKVTLREFRPGRRKIRFQLVVRDATDLACASVRAEYNANGYHIQARSSDHDLAEALRDQAMYE